jgi:hypothetical protein
VNRNYLPNLRCGLKWESGTPCEIGDNVWRQEKRKEVETNSVEEMNRKMYNITLKPKNWG